MSRGLTALAATLAAALLVPAAAQAQGQVIAGPAPTTYLTTSVTIAQGESLSLLQTDLTAPHDVASSDLRDGEFLFKSEVVDAPTVTPVVGVEDLAPGGYGYFCTIHPWMDGTLTVEGSGGGGGGDSTPPEVAVKVADGKLKKVRKSGKLRSKVTLDEPATVRIRAIAGKGKKKTVIAKGSRSLEDGSSRLAAKLTKKGKRLAKRSRRLKVTVRAVATDDAGNTSKARAKRTLK